MPLFASESFRSRISAFDSSNATGVWMPLRVANRILGFANSNPNDQLGQLVRITRALRHGFSIVSVA